MDVTPIQGILVRLTDKLSRAGQLSSGKPDEVGENIEDTFKDIAVYACLAIVLWREKQKEQ